MTVEERLAEDIKVEMKTDMDTSDTDRHRQR